MRNQFAVITLSLLLGLGACAKADTHESLSKESLSVMEQLATIVEGIKDKASADAAKPKLEALKTTMQGLKARMDKMPKPTAEQEAALKKELEPKMAAVMQRVMTAMMGVADKPEVQAALQEAMKGFDLGK